MPSRNPGRVKLARHLRKTDVPAERFLWSELRASKLGYKFRRQHPIGPYFVDFACCEVKLIVELDGDSHFILDGHARDQERSKWLVEQGWRIIRFMNAEVHEDLQSVVDTIAATWDSAAQPPSP